MILTFMLVILVVDNNLSNMEEFAVILGCQVTALPTTYLGLPLGVPYKFSRV